MSPAIQALAVAKIGTAAPRMVSIPTPAAGELLVRVSHVALNPADWKQLHSRSPPGAVIGFDYAGTVVAFGDAVLGYKAGDRVAGLVHGNSVVGRGASAQYIVADADLAWIVPDTLGLAEAVTWGVAAGTAAQAVYQNQGNPYPPATVESKPWFLVSGGATSVGLFAIQFAKLAGYRVVATASQRSFQLVKSYGADEVVDYSDPTMAIAQIKNVTKGKLLSGLEAAGGSSWAISLGSVIEGAKLTAILKLPEGVEPPAGVTVQYILLGDVFTTASGLYPFNPKDRAWAADFYSRVPSLIHLGVRANPIDLRDGLAAIPAGLDELKSGKVSGKKLVFNIA